MCSKTLGGAEMRNPFNLRIRHVVGLIAAIPMAVLVLTGIGSAAPPGATDLRIAKSASATQARVGATLGYTIQVENLGPLTASGVTVTDQLPKGTDFVSATSTLGQCSLKASKVTCEIGVLESGPGAKVAAAAVMLNVILRQAGSITNTASVKVDQKDSTAANNKASATTRVLAPSRSVGCRGVRATIIGTPGNDQIAGTGGRDVVATLGGDDRVVTRGGRDLICVGKGNDYVSAGSAADRVFAGPGRDRVLGRGGPDVLKGNGGNDLLKGNRGGDRLRGGRGFDRCYGGSGSDSVRCERPRRRG